MRHKTKKLAVIAAAALVISGCGKADLSDKTNIQEEAIQTERKQEENVKEGRESWEEPTPKPVDFSADDVQSWNQLLEENQISEEFKEGLKKFAFQTGIEVLNGKEENINYSPLSLYYALALAGCGAEGESAQEILTLLGMADQEDLANQCRKLYQWFYYRTQQMKEQDKKYGSGQWKSAINLGNSLWISNKFPVKADYQNLASQNFFAPAFLVDFSSLKTGQQMGEWISLHTNGLLAPVLTVDPDTALSIINTLYFYGGWHSPFNEGATKEDSFTRKDGSVIDCLFLNKEERQGQFKKEEGCTLSYLTTNNSCQMVFLLPDEGKKIEDFLTSPEQLRELMDGEAKWTRGRVIWKIPKFSFGSSFQLVDTMKDLGAEHIFDAQTAEFERISLEKPLYVSEIIQETHIGIDEQGVEGAAYTMITAAGATAIPDNNQYAKMILDRPFIYGIQERDSGAWLFLGVCANPSGKNE